MDPELLNRIVELTQSSPNFRRTLNRDLRSVLQHAFVSSPNAGASNLFIPSIACVLDSHLKFAPWVYAVFFRTHQWIPMPPGDAEEITSLIFSQDRILQSYVRDRLDSVQEIVTVAMAGRDNGMNLAIFNAEASCSTIAN
jgi:hypothetical protein